MSLMKVKNLSHWFENFGMFKNSRSKNILEDINFDINEGEALGLLGKSGSGKSTIAKILTGILIPKVGKIEFDGKGVKFENLTQRRAFYRQVQIVFQDALSAVNPRLSVQEVIEEPMIYLSNLDNNARIKRICELTEIFEISERFLHKPAHLLSGGQLQRICLARAMAINPRLIILDEALSSLDLTLQVEILKFLNTLKGKVAFLFITHDIRLARLFCDRIMLIDDGRIAEIANANEEFKSQIGEALSDAILPPFAQKDLSDRIKLSDNASF